MYDLTDAFITSLPAERWFQGRTRELRGITVVDAVRMSEKLLDCFVEVHYADGLPERYQVSVVQDETFSDATADPEACRLFAELAVADTSVRTDQGDRVTGHSVGRQLPDLGTPPRRLLAEQSNTSVVFPLCASAVRSVHAGRYGPGDALGVRLRSRRLRCRHRRSH